MSQKIALITGASRGLGAAMAEELASRGWHVVAVARTVGALEELDDRIKANRQPGGGALTLAPMDVTQDDAMRHLCLSVHSRWGHADLWMHCAVHVAPLAPAAHLDAKDWDKSITTNIRATGSLIPMVEPLLRAAEQGNGAVSGRPSGRRDVFRRLWRHQGRPDCAGAQLAGRNHPDRPARADRNPGTHGHRNTRALLSRRRPQQTGRSPQRSNPAWRADLTGAGLALWWACGLDPARAKIPGQSGICRARSPIPKPQGCLLLWLPRKPNCRKADR
jgi:hypothetical protein